MSGRVLPTLVGAADAAVARLTPVSEPAAQRATLADRAHRPWPMPEGQWVQAQTWRDLLFAHWSFPAEALRRVVPAELEVDTFDGRAWLGVTPFEVSGLRVPGVPPIPRLSRFPETNVRTYTTVDGRPGIYFLSLDAASTLAVLAARRTYRLPYHRATMTIERDGADIRYRSRRSDPAAELAARYRPEGAPFTARPGTLEHFLTERYCLYTVDERHRILRGEIHHPPWPLQTAVAEFERNTMAAPYGIELAGEPLLHYSARQDVLIWALHPAR